MADRLPDGGTAMWRFHRRPMGEAVETFTRKSIFALAFAVRRSSPAAR
ncbi:hypothetical protein [Burkholderia sp. Bp9031]|nr:MULTISPECIES: hypothetical protein [Burkholderia]